MIRLSRQADYAIMLLARIAGQEMGSVHAATELAGDTGVPLPMVAKILKRLAKGKLVVSHRGALGGYALARPAQDITVADILTVVDGPLGLTACTEGRGDECRLESKCSVHHAWRALNDAVVGALTRVSLAEMIAPRPSPQQQLVTVDIGHGAGVDNGAASSRQGFRP